MDNLNVEKLPSDEDSSSSPSSDTDIMVMNVYFQYQQQAQQEMAAFLQLTEATSKPRGKERFIKRDRQAAHNRLYKDYFAEDSLYNDHHFRRRFRMRRHLFLRIMEALGHHSEYFQVRFDATESVV